MFEEETYNYLVIFLLNKVCFFIVTFFEGGSVMKALKIVAVIVAIVGLSSVASASIFMEDFESYAPGSQMHGQGGWKGWDNTPGAGAPLSSAYAHSGSNSGRL